MYCDGYLHASLTEVQVILDGETPIEKMLSPVGIWASLMHFLKWCWSWKPQSIVDGTVPVLVVLASLPKQGEQPLGVSQ